MFRTKEMGEAINWLLHLYDIEDCEGMDIDTILALSDFDMDEVCLGIRNNVETAYQYSFSSVANKPFEYRGEELFNQRACFICSASIYEEEHEAMCVAYSKELWLLEDMTFVVVHSVDLECEDNYSAVETSYRYMAKEVESREDLFVSPLDLIEALIGKCCEIWEGDATIYEM